MRAVGYS